MLDIMDSMQQTPCWANGTGGPQWPRTFDGSFPHALYVSYGRLNKSLSHQSSPFLHPYSQKFTWILCTSLHLWDTNISYKVAVHLHIGLNGKCFERKPPNHSPILSYTILSIAGVPCLKLLLTTERPLSRRFLTLQNTTTSLTSKSLATIPALMAS